MYRLIALILISLSTITPAYAGGANTPCTAEDNAYSQEMGYGRADTAYRWGLEIQRLLRNKDTAGLMKLAPRELAYGPRKAYAISVPFDELFEAESLKRLLAEPPGCAPVGWRGYTLGRGDLWFNPTKDSANIRAISFTKDEPITPAPPVGWPHNDTVLSPDCFLVPWMSDDNFEFIAETYKIDLAAFSTTPGIFYGKEIGINDTPSPQNCGLNDCSDFSPIKPVKTCQKRFTDYETWRGSILFKVVDPEAGFTTEYDYKIIIHVPQETCQKLAPNLEAKCQAAYLVDWGEFSGGSIGRVNTIGLFGLFNLPAHGQTVVPLRFFPTQADGLNYVLDGVEPPSNKR